VSACSLADYEEAQRPRWRVGVSSVFTSTVMSFSSTLQAGETRFATLAEVAYAPTSRLSISVSLGDELGGRLLAPDGEHDFADGIAAGAGVSYRLVDGETAFGRGFVIASGAVSYTGSTTKLHGTGPGVAYDALDLRVGLSAGYTWRRAISAYLVTRAFGGPAFWSYQGASQLGTDTHHYQAGAGVAWFLFRRIDLFVEGVPLGEQALAGGLSVAL